jgi:hypothetical protein
LLLFNDGVARSFVSRFASQPRNNLKRTLTIVLSALRPEQRKVTLTLLAFDDQPRHPMAGRGFPSCASSEQRRVLPDGASILFHRSVALRTVRLRRHTFPGWVLNTMLIINDDGNAIRLENPMSPCKNCAGF